MKIPCYKCPLIRNITLPPTGLFGFQQFQGSITIIIYRAGLGIGCLHNCTALIGMNWDLTPTNHLLLVKYFNVTGERVCIWNVTLIWEIKKSMGWKNIFCEIPCKTILHGDQTSIDGSPFISQEGSVLDSFVVSEMG